jgi:hypothetical protein
VRDTSQQRKGQSAFVPAWRSALEDGATPSAEWQCTLVFSWCLAAAVCAQQALWKAAALISGAWHNSANARKNEIARRIGTTDKCTPAAMGISTGGGFRFSTDYLLIVAKLLGAGRSPVA